MKLVLLSLLALTSSALARELNPIITDATTESIQERNKLATEEARLFFQRALQAVSVPSAPPSAAPVCPASDSCTLDNGNAGITINNDGGARCAARCVNIARATELVEAGSWQCGECTVTPTSAPVPGPPVCPPEDGCALDDGSNGYTVFTDNGTRCVARCVNAARASQLISAGNAECGECPPDVTVPVR